MSSSYPALPQEGKRARGHILHLLAQQYHSPLLSDSTGQHQNATSEVVRQEASDS
jgi:hypothetical protein